MTLNIALNTIIIIMVFLFPGIIVRRSFFTNTFKNRYDNGGAIDKFVWNILVSIVSIILFSFLYNFIDYSLSLIEEKYKIFGNSNTNLRIEYHEIYCIFYSLSKGSLPIEFENYDNFIKYIIYILIVYLFSFVIGKLFYSIIKKSKVERWLSFFQFSNDWEYLTNPELSNFSDLKNKKGYTTWVDVLIGDKDNNSLYRGIVERIIYDKENKIENIILKKTIQFIQIDIREKDIKETDDRFIVNGKNIYKKNLHKKSNSQIVYKKIISGDFFVIPNKDIKNLNFSYIPPFIIDENTKTPILKNESKDYTHHILLLTTIILSTLWYFGNFSKYFLNNHIIIEVILKILKGSYLIGYFIIFIFTISQLIKIKRINKEFLSSVFLLVVLFYILVGILHNTPLIYSITVSLISLYIGSAIEVLLNRYIKNDTFSYFLAIISVAILQYLYFFSL